MPTLITILLSVLWALPAQQSQAVPRAQTVSPHGTLAQSCENCHTFTTWKPIRSLPEFDHNKTRYPLRGMHQNVTCTQCHTKLLFTNVGHACSDCHADIHRGQTGANCQTCHTVKGWRVSVRDISLHQNRFPLTGAHATLQCEDCHKQAAAGRFQGLSTDCYSCHAQQFKTAASVNHVASGFPPQCEACHTMDTWLGAKFDHARFTGFALTGIHATLDCRACHTHGTFKGMSANCFSCHAKDYNATTNPNHVRANFPQDCGLCHTTASWLGATFDHSKTGFPLTGAHATIACATCHVNNNYTSLATNCVGCHQKDFNATTNPNHVTAGFPTDCAVCHTTTAWQPATFDHSRTSFPLTGMHVNVPCASCHVNNNYTTLPTTCVGCHQKDFNSTTSPNHVSAGFPTDCTICHTTRGWTPASFNHNNTGFPLTGAHANVACATCHVNNNFTSLSTDCVGCHQNDYNKTTNPNHAAAGFPTTCAVCHTTTAWTPATFDHSKTPFPLTGAHLNVACASCHVNGRFAGTPTDCYSCHKADYTGTTNPNHQASQFPTTCDTCHNTTSWAGATFNHTWFPIYSGSHAGRWTTCADCHINSSNYAQFSCITCHEHSQANVAPRHSDVPNFTYTATSCYSCHPTGGGGG